MIEVISLDKTLKKRALDKSIVTEKNSKNWIDLTNPTREELKQVQQIFNLHKSTAEDFFPSKTRPKVDQFENYNSIVFYGIKIENGKIIPEEVVTVIGKNYLITSRHTKVESIEKIKEDKERVAELLKQGPEYLLHAAMEKTIENYFPTIEIIDTELDNLENEALRNPKPIVLERLFKIKRELLKLRRVVYPQREIIANLSVGAYPFLSKNVKSYFRDIYDHMVIITDLIEDQRETISSILEVHLSVTSNKLNEIMKILTVITTVLMPLTLIASIYGMNFKFMPELEWRYGYFMVLGLLLLVLIITTLFLKRKKWI